MRNISVFATTYLLICGICGSAALVRVPSIGLSPVKDTQPATPVSVTVQVCKGTV